MVLVVRRPEPLERAVRMLSGAPVLDGPARVMLEAVSRRFRFGAVKDVLSGAGLGHPNHPWLTDLPIGFWTNATFLDIFGGERSRVAARRLVGAGILSVVPTAVTGLSDLSDVDDAATRRIGVAHAAANSVALICYVASYIARARGRRGRLSSALGLCALTAGGYLGGHLVYRAGIGVNRSAFQPRIAEWTPVLADAELVAGEPRQVTIDGNEVMLLRRSDHIYALANRCSHRGAPLHEGEVDGWCVVCPWHFSAFLLEDGAIVRGPATAPQPAYDVRVVEGRIEVRSRA
ncbi:MAG: Rieske 2Fe-2S domain-containing protein [Actinomycetota bacterium]